MSEIWKDVIGYEGLYQISNLGNTKSLNMKVATLQAMLSGINPNKTNMQYYLEASDELVVNNKFN